MSRPVKDLIKSKGFTSKSSTAGRLIKKFEGTSEANLLWDFLRMHPSCRVVFNSLVKTPDYSLNDVSLKLPDLFKANKTSFVYHAKCKTPDCKTVLDAPNIANSHFTLPDKQEITCYSCRKKSILTASDYEPIFSVNLRDLRAFFNTASKSKILCPATSIECYTCGTVESPIDEKCVSILCPKCKANREVLTVFTPVQNIRTLIQNQQGHWLEWYVWRQLSDMGAEVGLEIHVENDSKLQCDVLLSKDDLLWVFECKDCESQPFTEKLYAINKVADRFVLVGNGKKLKPTSLQTAKQILGDKFMHIEPEDIDKISQKITIQK